jgi:outer membrane protein assembly factor BamA
MRLLLPFSFLFWFSNAFSQAIPIADDGHTAKEVIVRHINMSGNKRTKNEIIFRELSIKEGQSIYRDSISSVLKLNKQRLETIGLFTEIQVSADTISTSEFDLNIIVKERWYIIPEPVFQLADRNFNVWWTEQNRDFRRTIIGVRIHNKNFRGRLESLSITTQGGYTKKLGLDYIKPYIDKRQKHGLLFSISFLESQETFYSTDSNKLRFIKANDKYINKQFDISAGYVFRPAYASRHIFRLGLRKVTVADTVITVNPDYYENASNQLEFLELSYRLELNKTDNWNYPLRGTKIIAQAVTRLGLSGMRNQAFTTFELGQYNQLSKKWFTSAILRSRLSSPEKVPYSLNGALGTKYDYVRGYEYYVIDGSHFGILRLNLKYELLNKRIGPLPLKYLSMIPARIYPKIFTDAGYVQNDYPGNSFLNNRFIYSAGAGIDIFTAYDIKIRFEYTWNHLGQKGLFLHFSSE